MAFTIKAHGTRGGVIKHVQELKLEAPNNQPAQAAQFDAVKAFVIAEINGLATQFNGCRVDASGDAHEGCRQSTITVIPQNYHLD